MTPRQRRRKRRQRRNTYDITTFFVFLRRVVKARFVRGLDGYGYRRYQEVLPFLAFLVVLRLQCHLDQFRLLLLPGLGGGDQRPLKRNVETTRRLRANTLRVFPDLLSLLRLWFSLATPTANPPRPGILSRSLETAK